MNPKKIKEAQVAIATAQGLLAFVGLHPSWMAADKELTKAYEILETELDASQGIAEAEDQEQDV